MKAIIFFFGALLFLPGVLSLEHFYEIHLIYENGNITYDSIMVKPTDAGITNLEGGFVAETVDSDNSVLNATFFEIPLLIAYDTIESKEIVGGGVVNLNSSDTTLRLPYFENAKRIYIYDSDMQRRLTIDVSSFSKSAAAAQAINTPIQHEAITATANTKQFPYAILIGIIVFLAAIIILLRRFSKK